MVLKEMYILAWTTTPWTLPSNTALAVGKDIEYAEVITINRYTKRKTSSYFSSKCYR